MGLRAISVKPTGGDYFCARGRLPLLQNGRLPDRMPDTWGLVAEIE